LQDFTLRLLIRDLSSFKKSSVAPEVDLAFLTKNTQRSRKFYAVFTSFFDVKHTVTTAQLMKSQFYRVDPLPILAQLHSTELFGQLNFGSVHQFGPVPYDITHQVTLVDQIKSNQIRPMVSGHPGPPINFIRSNLVAFAK
jgi:hypothetical protein